MHISARLKMGVIGLGRMGQLYVRMLATQVSGVHLYAVADVDRQEQTQMAKELSVPHTFADAYDLIALPELDAVVITTPTRTHYDLVISAASAGKAIFCEKPLALTLEETRTALEAVARAQVLLQVGFMSEVHRRPEGAPLMYQVRRVNIGQTAQLDELARECGKLCSQTVTSFWRTVRKKGIWLKPSSLMRWHTSHKLHAHTADATVQAFFAALKSWRKRRQNDPNAHPPRRRRWYFRIEIECDKLRLSTLLKQTALRLYVCASEPGHPLPSSSPRRGSGMPLPYTSAPAKPPSYGRGTPGGYPGGGRPLSVW